LIATVTNAIGEIVALQSTEISLERLEPSLLGPRSQDARGGLLAKARSSWEARMIRHKLWFWSGHAMRMRASDQSGSSSQSLTIAVLKSSLTTINGRLPGG
jgi:hypothetical protein